MNTYDVGDRVRVSVAFTDSNGVATDPTTVTFKYRQRRLAIPTNPVVTLTYPTDAALVRDSAGAYHVDIDVTEEGITDYRFQGTGAVVAAQEGAFNVPDSQFF